MNHVLGPLHILLAEKEGRSWFNIICRKLCQFKRITWWCLSVMESILESTMWRMLLLFKFHSSPILYRATYHVLWTQFIPSELAWLVGASAFKSCYVPLRNLFHDRANAVIWIWFQKVRDHLKMSTITIQPWSRCSTFKIVRLRIVYLVWCILWALPTPQPMIGRSWSGTTHFDKHFKWITSMLPNIKLGTNLHQVAHKIDLCPLFNSRMVTNHF